MTTACLHSCFRHRERIDRYKRSESHPTTLTKNDSSDQQTLKISKILLLWLLPGAQLNLQQKGRYSFHLKTNRTPTMSDSFVKLTATNYTLSKVEIGPGSITQELCWWAKILMNDCYPLGWCDYQSVDANAK